MAIRILTSNVQNTLDICYSREAPVRCSIHRRSKKTLEYYVLIYIIDWLDNEERLAKLAANSSKYASTSGQRSHLGLWCQSIGPLVCPVIPMASRMIDNMHISQSLVWTYSTYVYYEVSIVIVRMLITAPPNLSLLLCVKCLKMCSQIVIYSILIFNNNLISSKLYTTVNTYKCEHWYLYSPTCMLSVQQLE